MSVHKKDASGKHSVLSLLCNSFLPWTFPCSYLPLLLSELRGDFVHRYKTTAKKRRSITCPAEPGTPISTTLPLEKTQEVSVRQAVFQYEDTSSPQWECMTIHNRSYLPQNTIILLVWHRISSWFFFLIPQVELENTSLSESCSVLSIYQNIPKVLENCRYLGLGSRFLSQ